MLGVESGGFYVISFHRGQGSSGLSQVFFASLFPFFIKENICTSASPQPIAPFAHIDFHSPWPRTLLRGGKLRCMHENRAGRCIYMKSKNGMSEREVREVRLRLNWIML